MVAIDSASIYFLYLQVVIAQINHAIGAAGVVSQECKQLVAQYGKTILDMLVNEVSYDLFVFLILCVVKLSNMLICFCVCFLCRLSHNRFALKLDFVLSTGLVV